ncbi:dTDP-glucose 4,6-dehydratase [Maricaulis sp. W15]|uniref:dTDP-glucose 4,6-dehydratase n=1 Tax=Maricaulis sp. W15 TaxID=1772333 RepID=UPI000948C3A2|nr:dTDP-glucose 4,6-dehydratase [Maricaulis sp. W15]
MKILVTGGLGFIGSSVVRQLVQSGDHEVVVLDAMTYAALPEAVESCVGTGRYRLEVGDIRDVERVRAVFESVKPDLVMHLAAESHVDRSIDGPGDFIQTNIVGTFNMLQAARAHLETLDAEARSRFRFHHISTDEVFGSLSLDAPGFTETTRYDPRSPYSASKAASDHLVRAWGETYGLPVVLSNCSNNYGPWQYPEKLIPLMIAKGRDRLKLPVYGKGANVRDWLHVEDHAEALILIAQRGQLGESYNVGGGAERTNLDVVHAICASLDERFPEAPPHRELISFVTDRPGHDFRYAIDYSRIERELGWRPKRTFTQGLADTVNWYLDNEAWWRGVLDRSGGGQRVGLGTAGNGKSAEGATA